MAALVGSIQFFTDDSSPLGLGVLRIAALPGYLPAALVFPDGFHSGSPYAFMGLVIIFDGLIYGLPAMLLWRSFGRGRSGGKSD